MSRKRQGKARAQARARDGSVPSRASSRATSSEQATSSHGTSDIDSDSDSENVAEPGAAGNSECPPRKKSRRTGPDSPAHQRDASTASEQPSWLDTPEPQKPSPASEAQAGPSTSRAVVLAQPKQAQGGVGSSTAGVQSSATGYRQRGPVAGPSTAAPRSTSTASKLKRKSKDKKPFALAATVYTPIPIMSENRASNFCGVVVSYRLPTRANYGTGDYNMNINLVDQWCYNSTERLSLNLFARQADDLPGHIDEGMVLLIRQVRIRYFNGKLTGTVFKDKLSWATLKQSGDYRQLTGVIVHRQEREHMQELAKWYAETYLGQQPEDGTAADTAETDAIAAAVTHNLKRTITLDQLQDNTFCHCIAEVVRVYPKLDRPEIYITDYTSHGQLDIVNNKDIGWTQDDIDRFTSNRTDKGGGSVLKITLWEEQVNAVLALTPGTMIYIKNLRCKRSGLEMLEGSIGGARTQREFKENKWQIQKLKKTDALVAALLKRKGETAETLKMERMLAWPDSGESADKTKQEAQAVGPSKEPAPAVAQTDSTGTPDDANGDNAAEGASKKEKDAVPAAEGAQEEPEDRVRRLTESAAKMRAAMSGPAPAAQPPEPQPEQETQTSSDPSQPPVPRLDKGKGKAIEPESSHSNSNGTTNSHSTQHSLTSTMSTPSMPVLALMPPPPLPFIADDDTTSGEAMVQSSDETGRASGTTTSGTPSVMYSMPPPGQRPREQRTPTSSFPSASQIHVEHPPPFTSTPLDPPPPEVPIRASGHLTSDERERECEDDSSMPSVLKPVTNAEAAEQRRRRLVQDRADELVVCKLAKQKEGKMGELLKGFGLGAKHHVSGRVVDTIPRDPSRWVRARCQSCQRNLPDTDNFCAPCADEEGQNLAYEWMFALVLQEDEEGGGGDVSPPASLPVIVSGESGNAFLPGFEPAKHRRDAKARRRLYERLQAIFGLSPLEKVTSVRSTRAKSTTTSSSSGSGSSVGSTSQSDRPVVHLGVYAFRLAAPPGSTSAKAGGDIKFKLCGTTLVLKGGSGRTS